jgi:HEAT repeat protein
MEHDGATMIRKFIAPLIAALLCHSAQAKTAEECKQVAIKIHSSDEGMYLEGLQELLDNSCNELLPIVESRLTSRKAPLLAMSAVTLALSGKREYGPVLIELYHHATHPSRLSKEIYGKALQEAVLLACSDLPGGRRLGDHDEYRQGVYPPISDACWERYHSLFKESDYTEPLVSRGTLDLLAETSSPGGIDIIARFMAVGDQYVRHNAVVALEHVPLAASEKLFRTALADPNENVRYQAVRILSGKFDPRVESLFADRLPLETNGQLIDLMKERLNNRTGR